MSLIPRYSNSRAIIIGINKYDKASPLGYAVNDATSIAESLKHDYGFEHIDLLIDDNATKTEILNCFLSLASDGTQENDRVVFFFAGHGHTVRSKRGEVGYLVPFDGDPTNLATLIRWDELTRNADLIDAKHIMFIMDACYGGLAITRALKPGSMRFLKDMLLRPTRQVLTAGKANEVVADLGGPLPAHSVFTGHLIEALSGKAKDADGLLTANGLMAYVYQMVAQDQDSHQTPHYGYLNGDGDFIFSAPQLAMLEKQEKQEEVETDILVSVPAIFNNHGDEEMVSIVSKVKEYISEDRYRINLHDLVIEQVKQVLSMTGEVQFPVSSNWSPDEFITRLSKYENITKDLQSIQALLGYWASESQLDMISMPAKKMSTNLKSYDGLIIWNSLRWYPILLLLYIGGIAALASENYHNLRALFRTPIKDPEGSDRNTTIILATIQGLSGIRDAFKQIVGYERLYTPRSEYILKLLQPRLDDLLFLGNDYEFLFDRFEVFLAIDHAEQLSSQNRGRTWGPVGRFGWKYRGSDGGGPYSEVIAEAKKHGSIWRPFQAGLFGGSLERFEQTTSNYTEGIMNNLGWF